MAKLTRMNSRLGAFANLCDEEILEIFKFLPLRERKIARLVCKQWNAVLLRKPFTENEISCVPNWYSFSLIGDTLKTHSISELTLKFVCRNFDSSSKNLWKALGNKVKSLYFDWCNFDSEGLMCIFNYCDKLKEFSASNSLFSTKPGWIFIIPRNLTTFLFGNKLVGKNLQKLHFDSGSANGSACFRERDLFVIASIFPKLKTLEIQLLLNYADSKMKAYVPRYHIPLSKLQHIEAFDIELHLPYISLEQYQFIKFQKMCNIDFNGKKNIQMNLNSFLLRVESLDTVLSGKYWVSLVLFEINLHPSSNVTFIANLLDKLPLLEKFKLCLMMKTDGDKVNQMINILFPALVKSRLTHLYIEIPTFKSSTNTCIPNISSVTSSVNHTVRHLSIIESEHSNSQLSSLFVKHFLGVIELNAELGDPNIVFQHQKHLQRLVLHLEDDLKIGGIGNESSQLFTLQNIKIFNCQPSHWKLFERHQFPNLAQLLISSYKGYDSENNDKSQEDSLEKFESLISSIPSSCPNVEVFEFCWEGYPQGLCGSELPRILQCCQKFQQLRYLSLKINYKECSQSKKLLKKALILNFQQCTSLRAVWLQLCCINLLGYRNILTKKYEFCEGDLTFVPELYCHSWMFK